MVDKERASEWIEFQLRFDVPLPFDHFFFCFLPPAAGACKYCQYFDFRR